jgi:hypothetical protein
MLRTLALAALVTLFGAVASQAQYRDSAPPDEQGSPQYDTQTPYNGYDEELLGPYDDQRHNVDRYDGRYDTNGYSRPNVDVGIFANLTDGRWFLTANFGWVWRPYASYAGWRPYRDGRWVWTSYGWTWVSYEPFGWATYHYGYWNCDAALGWVWIPGYDWSACRVQWAYYDDYICWAPLPPPGYSCPRPYTTAGFNIWFTIGASHFCDPYPAHYYVRPAYHTVYSPRVAYKSPARTYVQTYTRTPIRESKVVFKNRTVVRGSNVPPATRSQTVFKSKPSTRTSQPLVRDTRTVTRDSRTFAQQQPRQQFKGSSQKKGFTDARAMQERQRAPGQTRQFQPREQTRSYSREGVSPLIESRSKNVARGGDNQRVERDAPGRDAQRSIERNSAKHGGDDVVKMKGRDNGRGNGKH